MARRFTLRDPEYYDAMRRVAEALTAADVPFCLVGGGAAQAWIASLRTDAGTRRIGDEPLLATALRQTRDLDFATRMEAAELLALLNELAAASTVPAQVLGPRALRLGDVAVSFTLEPADLAGMQDLYDTFLDARVPLTLRIGARPDEVPTIALEELLVTKITRRGDKSKDLLDVDELVAAARAARRTIDFDRVRELVHDRPDALGLIDELLARTSAETP